MVDVRLRIAAIPVAVLLGGAAAQAADYSPPPPPCYDAGAIATGRAPPGAVPCYVPPPPAVEEFSGWYLRGDIGMSNQSVKNLDNALYANAASVQGIGMGFDAAPILGLGVGYYFNDWLRFDVTGEYRGRANFHGLDIYTPTNGGPPGTDEYRGSKSEWLFLANAYVDLGTWNNLTPFVGAGIGFSRNTIHSFTDTCITIAACPGGSVAYGATASKWNLAWALHAGVSYKVSKNFAVELAYRYTHLGNAASGDLIAYDGTNNVFNPMEFKSISSHDIRLGLRMNLDAFSSSSSYSPVVYSQPQPSSYSVYAQAPAPAYTPPAPVYAQPTYAQPSYAQPTYAQPAPVYQSAPIYAPQVMQAPRR